MCAHVRESESIATADLTGVGDEGEEEGLEEGELPSDEEDIEIDATSELTVHPAPEIEQDEEDLSDHQVGGLFHLKTDSSVSFVRGFHLSVHVALVLQAVSEVSGTGSVHIVGVTYQRCVTGRQDDMLTASTTSFLSLSCLTGPHSSFT